MFALICGYLPFEDPVTTNLYKKIMEGNFHIPKFVSKEAAELMRRILCTDPDSRIRIAEIKRHPWFNIHPRDRHRQFNGGIIVGINEIPVSGQLLKVLEEQFGFKAEQARKALASNKHNHLTTTYYLLLKKYE